MKIKCVITDDEPIARKGLRGYIERIDFLDLVGECQNAVRLNNFLKETEVDLIFLDIEMPKISGLDFLDGLNNPPLVIITTAYEKYALKGYEFHVTDYLLKPIPFSRFLKAVNNAYAIMQKEHNIKEQPSYIFVRSDKQLKKIVLEDILFIESIENYILIHLSQSREIVHAPLKQILSVLPQNDFIQVHRSYIINISKVEAITGNQLKIGKHLIPIG